MITILVSILVFGVVIFIHEFGHFMTARRCGIDVVEFAIGMGPKLFGWQGKRTLYTVRLLPIGGFCQMEGEDEDSDAPGAFNNASAWRRFRVILAGARNNIILGLLILSLLTAVGGSIASTKIYSFDEGAVTKASGLMEGDTILKVNGKRLYTANDIMYEMMWIKDGTADLEVRRDGKVITLKDVKFNTTLTEEGISLISIDFVVYGVKKTVWNVIKESVGETLSLTRQIYMSLVQLITGAVPVNSLSGPVGIIKEIGEAASYGIESVLFVMAYLSINLGIMNVLPIPALDGGRLLLIIVEMITGKKLSQKWESIVNMAGFFILIGLMVFITFNDVSRLLR